MNQGLAIVIPSSIKRIPEVFSKSDYDFYIIVPDENYDNIEQTNTAYCSLIGMKRKPVDIIVGNKSLFEQRKTVNSIEKIVAKEGVLLYER